MNWTHGCFSELTGKRLCRVAVPANVTEHYAVIVQAKHLASIGQNSRGIPIRNAQYLIVRKLPKAA